MSTRSRQIRAQKREKLNQRWPQKKKTPPGGNRRGLANDLDLGLSCFANDVERRRSPRLAAGE